MKKIIRLYKTHIKKCKRCEGKGFLETHYIKNGLAMARCVCCDICDGKGKIIIETYKDKLVKIK